MGSCMRLHHPRVQAEVANTLRLKKILLVEFPDLDETTLADTLEGATNLHELLAYVVRSALEDEALATGLSLRLAELKGRLQRS